jgi:hypothetical protein
MRSCCNNFYWFLKSAVNLSPKKRQISPSVPKGTLSLNWPYLYTRLILCRKHRIMSWGQYLLLVKSRVRLKCFHAMGKYPVHSQLQERDIVCGISIFWEITPCSSLKDNRRLGGTNRLHLAWLILQHWGWRRHVPPKHLLIFQRTTRRQKPEDRTLQILFFVTVTSSV